MSTDLQMIAWPRTSTVFDGPVRTSDLRYNIQKYLNCAVQRRPGIGTGPVTDNIGWRYVAVEQKVVQPGIWFFFSKQQS